MKAIGIIPARYASTRFPGKPLAMLGGKSIIQRVYEKCLTANSLDKVLVATDDDRIFQHVQGFGAEVVMTDADLPNGSARVEEAYRKVKSNASLIVNIQGDEPFIHAQHIDSLVSTLKNGAADIATLAKRIGDLETLMDENVVKIVLSKQQKALYFSRAPIPFQRQMAHSDYLKQTVYYKHIGIYAFRSQVLPKLIALDASPLEQAEKLEQLRWLENGYTIDVAETNYESIGIDSPEDLLKAQEILG